MAITPTSRMNTSRKILKDDKALTPQCSFYQRETRSELQDRFHFLDLQIPWCLLKGVKLRQHKTWSNTATQPERRVHRVKLKIIKKRFTQQ